MLAALLLMGQAVMAQVPNYNKLSGGLEVQLRNYMAETAVTRSNNLAIQEQLLLTLIKADSEETLTSQGVHVLDNVGDIYFAVVPMSRIAQLSLDNRVVCIEAGYNVNSKLDFTPENIGVDKVWNGQEGLPLAYKGKGVLVGICDSGFDFTHPMFLNADGSTRIKYAWDCMTGRGASEGYQGIGSLYDTPEKILKAVGSVDSMATHGSYVAGIAVGSAITTGNGKKYSGIAPESDIALFMSCTSYNHFDPRDLEKKRAVGENLADDLKKAYNNGNEAIAAWWKKETYSNIAILMGMKQFFAYADEHKMPAVLNCSFGGMMNFINDYSLEEEVIHQLVGPGHIIVASAGNEGDADYYRHKKAGETFKETLISKLKTCDFEFATYKDDFEVTLVYDDAAKSTVTFKASDYNASVEENMKTIIIDCGHDKKLPFGVNVASKRVMKDGRTAWNLQIVLPHYTDVKTDDDELSDGAPDKRTVSVTVTSSSEMVLLSDAPTCTFSGGSEMINAPYTINRPGAYNDVICAGATGRRIEFTNASGKVTTSTSDKNTPYDVISWSSCGPTLDGRRKPDVLAPGRDIISSQNSNLTLTGFFENITAYTNNLVESWSYNKRRYTMAASSGTSMSTPVVTGIVALWLEANPKLTPAQVLDVIAATSTAPLVSIACTDPMPNNVYGYGEINAIGGLKKILGIDTAIKDLPSQHIGVSLNGHTLHIEGCDNAEVTLYSLTGQPVFNGQVINGTVELPNLANGVYAVKVGNQGSTLIRL